MKYRFSAWYFKLIAFVLAVLCLGVGFFSGILTLWMGEQGHYDTDSYWSSWAARRAVQWETHQIHSYMDPGWSSDGPHTDFSKLPEFLEDGDLRYILLNEDGSLVTFYLDGLKLQTKGLNFAKNDFSLAIQSAIQSDLGIGLTPGAKGSLFEGLYFCTEYIGFEDHDRNGDGEITENECFAYTLVCLVDPDDLTEGGALAQGLADFERIHPLRFQLPVIFAVCALVFLALTVFLCVQAGHRPNVEEIQRSWLDKWPLDLLLVLSAAAVFGIIGIICLLFDGFNNYYYYRNYASAVWDHVTLPQVLALGSVAAVLCGGIDLAALCSLFVRLKAGKWWENSLIWKLGLWVWGLAAKLLAWVWGYVKRPLGWTSRMLKRFFDVFPQAAKALPLAPRLIGCLLGLLALDFFLGLFALGFESGFLLCLFILYNLALLAAAIYACGQLKLLWNAAEHLSRGELDFQLDTSKMYWDFKKHGDDLNAIAVGLNKAVDQRMKSERLKTELITNVSHDIKTPLTSIVNYVDLLQKPHTDAEGVQYLEVLDRQSRKLKRLTENLVEASKASTGNLPVELAPTSVTELLNQAAEEYRERLEAGRLELVLTTGTDLSVLADGKLLWRILDNLLGNVIKYALAGTRVYLSAAEADKTVTIAVKNISRESLNVSAEELLERFVRGDASRHAEGSGLGLNIAQSLTKLQNGQFRLTVDGDLFKAEVELPSI